MAVGMRCFIAAYLGFGIAIAGCGGGEKQIPGRTVATGSVTFDGQPMKGGTITFAQVDPPQARISCGIIDGRYESERVPVGENLVAVETESLKYGNASAFVKIPDKYNDPKTSGLTATFKEGENTDVNFALEK